jgi:NAD(P)-dependent dehydrogenase (short-subunit alcohol dehydrogenase family)
MASLEGRTVLITGATDGLGRALADDLAGRGAALVLHGRRADRLADVAAQLRENGTKVDTVLADFSKLGDVRTMADEITNDAFAVDVLVNNAGIGSGAPAPIDRTTTVDGYELRFAVNYLAPALLTARLLPRLRQRPGARVVNVASIGQHPLDFANLMLTEDYSGTRAYAQSKLALIMLGFELAQRVPATEVTINSLHPGTYMPTKMVLQSVGRTVDTLETGVNATSRLVRDPSLRAVTGAYFNIDQIAQANSQAYDARAKAKLWQVTEALLGEPLLP